MNSLFKVTAFCLYTSLVFLSGHALCTWAHNHGDIHRVLNYCSDGLKRLLAEQEHAQ